jgi:hypothetical protein
MKDKPSWQRFLVAISPAFKRALNYIIVFVIRLIHGTINIVKEQI